MKKIFLFILFSIFIYLLLNVIYEPKILKNKIEHQYSISYELKQKNIDKEIIKYINNKSFNFDNPKIILNPYETSPLCALLIFWTSDTTNIDLYVNDVFMTKFEKSNSHILNIYGLRENYNNKITIIDDNKKSNTFYIKTDKVKYRDFYKYETSNTSNEYLFINSPSTKFIIDNSGYISWYYDINNYAIDIDDDKRIYIIDAQSRIVELDFMGRVYKVYNSEADFFGHTIDKLNNGNFLISNSNNEISLLDGNSGKVINRINIIEKFKEIDDKFNIPINEYYLNYFDYNEDDNTILISLRGLDAIVKYDIINSQIIWIFSDNDMFSNKFDKYMIKLTNGSYFKGQHTPHLVGNLLYVYNNNNYFVDSSKLNDLNKSSAVIYEINDMKAEEVYRYDTNHESIYYGNFYEKNNIKNINFGCLVNETDLKYSLIIEIYNNNIVSNLETKAGDILVYQSFRQSFYKNITPNYQLNKSVEKVIDEDNYLDINDLKVHHGGIKLKKELEKSFIDETLLEFFDNRLSIKSFENLEILFVNAKYNFYNLNIDFNKKNIDDWNNYINNFMLSISGKYAIYIKINDKYYNTNLVLNIS